MESHLTDAEELIRNSDEYAAAFNLEIWKAQQQARFHIQLRQAKEKLEKRVLLDLRRKEKKKMEELENMRQDVEKAAQRLKDAGEALQRRTFQFEAREAAFDARRVKVAEQHELHLNRLEQRTRRSLEEATAQQDFLKAQLHEKDLAVMQLKEKLQSVEAEYDLLQRKTARSSVEHSESESKALQIAKRQIFDAEKVIKELKQIVVDRTQLVRDLRRENDSLKARLQQTQLDLEDWSKKYNGLLSEWHTREYDRIRKERRELEDEKRRKQSPGKRDLDIGESDPLYAMLQSFKENVVSHLGQLASTSRLEEPASLDNYKAPPYIYAERAVSPTKVHTKKQKCGVRFTSRPLSPAEAANTTTEKEAATVDIPSSSTNLPRFASEKDVDASAQRMIEVEIPTADISTSAYPRVEVPSWRSDNEEETSRDFPAGGGSVMLPPLAPVVMRHESGKDRVDSSGLSPTPQDFMQASQVGACSGESAHAEMRIFVSQLKINRQKLLDTGVYAESHPVIKEMSEKIALYEQYLSNLKGVSQ